MADIKDPEKTDIEPYKMNRLLSDETHERVRAVQTYIREQTELVPSIRKIINEILNERELNLYIKNFIEKHGS